MLPSSRSAIGPPSHGVLFPTLVPTLRPVAVFVPSPRIASPPDESSRNGRIAAPSDDSSSSSAHSLAGAGGDDTAPTRRRVYFSVSSRSYCFSSDAGPCFFIDSSLAAYSRFHISLFSYVCIASSVHPYLAHHQKQRRWNHRMQTPENGIRLQYAVPATELARCQ